MYVGAIIPLDVVQKEKAAAAAVAANGKEANGYIKNGSVKTSEKPETKKSK